MFDKLQQGFQNAFSIFKKHQKITEKDVYNFTAKIKKILIESDVNINIINLFINKIQLKCINKNILLHAIRPKDIMIKVVHDELVSLLGNKNSKLNIKSNPSIILVVGLQGSGKTTFCNKLANYLKYKKLRNPLLVSTDFHRPAAIEQLNILSKKFNIDYFNTSTHNNYHNLLNDLFSCINENKTNDIIIIDTAGRNVVNTVMMKELQEIYIKSNPAEILFVIDAMTGQDALISAKVFNTELNYSGVVLTKLDSDAKGGIALTIKHLINKPIKFISTGENVNSIYKFHPERMAKRILGMGDIVTLVEKAQEQFSKKQTKKIYRKIIKNEFNFNDLLSQINKIKKMGDLKDIIAMIPGLGNLTKNINFDNSPLSKIEHMISSMTLKERENPNIIDTSRKKRIATGSGYNIKEVDNLLDHFYKIKEVLKNPKHSDLNKIIKNIINKK